MLNRRIILSAVGLVATQVSLFVAAESGPIRIVIPGPPGGGADSVARLIAEKLQNKLGQAVIVDSRPGAAGLVASKYVMSQPADGQTLYLSSAMLATAPALDPEIQKFNPMQDFTPIAQLTKNTVVFVVRKNFPANDTEGFIDYCRKNPGTVSLGTVGPATTTHLASAMLAKGANIDVNIAHYKGSAPGNQDLIGGVIDARIDNLAGVFGIVDSGYAKVIAVVGKERSPLFPNVKRLSETVPGIYIDDHFVIVGPAKMRQELAERYSSALREIVKMLDVSNKLRDQMGAISMPLNPRQTLESMRSIFEDTKSMVSKVDLKS